MAKQALVVGINDYTQWQSAPNFQFPSLRTATVDAAAFAKLLTTSLGFLPANVTLCQNNEATLESVLGGLHNMFASSQPGDVLCFYFAGLGTRTPENGWSGAGSRFYDALVPYDAAGMIFDFQLSSLAQDLLPAGVNLTVVVDASHCSPANPADSGNNFRTVGWPATAASLFAAQCHAVIPLAGLTDATAMDGNITGPSSMGGGVSLSVNTSLDFSPRASAVLFTACDYGEQVLEVSGAPHASFTNALLQAVPTPNGSISHADLLTALRAKVGADSNVQQTPQLRGAAVSQQSLFLAPPLTAGS